MSVPAQRAGAAHITDVTAGHLSLISRPGTVTEVILEAAQRDQMNPPSLPYLLALDRRNALTHRDHGCESRALISVQIGAVVGDLREQRRVLAEFLSVGPLPAEAITTPSRQDRTVAAG